ncbi:hypothetical protein C169_20119 [Paenibacillus sp. FSL R5-808]|nr:hypothetical protein C169_20119 [Paenibacillus sp. FSL R5-808]
MLIGCRYNFAANSYIIRFFYYTLEEPFDVLVCLFPCFVILSKNLISDLNVFDRFLPFVSYKLELGKENDDNFMKLSPPVLA